MKNYLLFFLFFYTTHSFGNDLICTDSTIANDTIIKYRKFRFALDYSSENAFKGRKNTINIPILSPSFKFTAKNGFYIQTSLVNVPNAKIKKVFDELDAGAGWLFYLSDKWDGSVSYTHFFYNANVARLKSAVQNDINASLGFDYKVLYSQILFDYNSGNIKNVNKKRTVTKQTQDYSLTIANMHYFYFYFKNEKKLTISPEVDVLFGTQNFYAAYQGKLDPTVKTKYQQQASAFTLSAFAFYTNFNYKINRFAISLTPSYTIPQNVPEGGSSTPFFVMSGRIYYTIKSAGKSGK